ncbi:MAG: hypothetical protein WAT67_08020 [Candidatus Contendobacter sp.]
MSESASFSAEHRLRLAELAMQLTVASLNHKASIDWVCKNQPGIDPNKISALQFFDLIYDHLSGKVGM